MGHQHQQTQKSGCDNYMDSHWHRPTLKMAFLIMWNEGFLDFYMLHLCELSDRRSIDETIHILQYAYT